jgi:hypothetical protein
MTEPESAELATQPQLESLTERVIELEARVATLERGHQVLRLKSEAADPQKGHFLDARERETSRLRSAPRDPAENRHYEPRGDAVYVVGDGQAGYGQSCVVERCRGFEMHSAAEVAERVAKLLNMHGL